MRGFDQKFSFDPPKDDTITSFLQISSYNLAKLNLLRSILKMILLPQRFKKLDFIPTITGSLGSGKSQNNRCLLSVPQKDNPRFWKR